MTAITARAHALGTEHGSAAASWVIDGNTTDATKARLLAGILDGDPAVLNQYDENVPTLQDYELATALGINPNNHRALDAAADAYSLAAGDSFWTEVERLAAS